MSAPPHPTPSELVPSPCVGRVFRADRGVRLGDVSPSGRLRLDAAARFLQDVSSDDNVDAALPERETWVVRKTVIEVAQAPRYLEPLDLATWCSGTGSHWAERRISITGRWGGAIEASTTWVYFDRSSGRPQRVSEAFMAIYGEASEGRRIKARLLHSEPPVEAERRPWPLRTTDFDVLAHVNNAAYWEAVEEALVAHGPRPRVLRAELEHRHAIEPGASVELVTHRDPDGDVLWVWLVTGGVVAASAWVQPVSS
ncbi:acyl-[acyl-carrier-protein] thioesterase [Nitrosomonas communis]|uniref:acyl-[acyl-carrier-protein] thioesterase n=1 Tax=Nitrosomonas communis TaxID=44574 RepID=UPI003D2B03A8